MKVAIKTIKGSYHEIAARQFFPNQQRLDIVEENDFETLLDDVVAWKADYWVIEIENTITGAIYDYLNYLKDKDIAIVWENYIKLEKDLLGLPWTTLSNIKFACWEHTAIEQTRKTFEKNYPNIKLIECWNLADAWREMKEKNLNHVWLIAWRLAAKIYGLNILIDKINSDKKNFTRFLLIQAKSKKEEKEFNKATIHIQLTNQVWSLMKILSIIAAYEISLTKIESIPVIWEPSHYSFYIDLNIKNVEYYHYMIRAITPLIKKLDILGEYEANDKIQTEN